MYLSQIILCLLMIHGCMRLQATHDELERFQGKIRIEKADWEWQLACYTEVADEYAKCVHHFHRPQLFKSLSTPTPTPSRESGH